MLAADNQGPSVGFKIYNPELASDPYEEFEYEFKVQDSVECRERLKRNNSWHHEVFMKRDKIGLFTNWVEFIAHASNLNA